MSVVAIPEEELQALRQAAQERDAALAERQELRSQLRLVTAERDLLKEKLAARIHELFAASSEARGTNQKDLFFNEAEALAPVAGPGEDDAGAGIPVAGHTRQKRGRKPLDPNLPRQVIRHELPVGERHCPHDGVALVEIGADISEQLDIVPQQVRVIQHQRIKYACPCCDQGMRSAPAPARVIPKGLLTEAALAWVAVAKYQDGLPLYRQAALLGRFGGDLSRNTLAGAMVRIGEAVQPVINLLRDHLLESDLVHGDETTIQVLKEPGRPAQAQSYLWAQMNGTGPPVRLFGYAPGRGGTAAARLYAGIRPGAVLMSDGYEVYNNVAATHGLIHLGCWAHARRYFVKAEEALPKAERGGDQVASRFIAAIAQLYAVEARGRDLTPAQRGVLRQAQSRPVLDQIGLLLQQHLHTVAPASLLGKALHYLQGQWVKLVRYPENGVWPIDNNACENAIRPFVVGRRNWLFTDTVAGAQASANLYSLIETCKANGVEPYRYLTALLRSLPAAVGVDDYEALLPWNLAPRP